MSSNLLLNNNLEDTFVLTETPTFILKKVVILKQKHLMYFYHKLIQIKLMI